MANISEIAATTIQSRTRTVADNVTKNNAILAYMSDDAKQTFSGGETILQEMSYQENANGGFYSGYDVLPVGATDQITAAEYAIKQAAVPVTISGLEELKNAGRERMINLLSSRIRVAESTMSNIISGSLYSDGTGTGGKEIDGLDTAIPTDPTTGTYGGIDRATWTFWRSGIRDVANTDTLMADMNGLYASLCRGQDKVDLIMMDSLCLLYTSDAADDFAVVLVSGGGGSV